MKNFDELNLSPSLMRAISELGYTEPSAIQAEALPILLGEPTDFLGLAATGTGKTAAFAIPMLERMEPSIRTTQALILCPTRELALQITGQINLLGKYKGIRALPVYGGAGYGDQIHGLKHGAPVVVGTPGRVVDHLKRGTLRLGNIQTVILDEADEMISMGFKEDLKTILESIPQGNSNIWLFSATMSREIRTVADEYMNQPKQVQINRTEILPPNIEQIFYLTHESNKPEILCKLVDAAEQFYGLVFCQTKSLVTELTQYLKGKGYASDCLHGDMDQNARERTMQAFRDRKSTLLICTDIASRGLDVKDVTHVINYSIPRELEHYVHRIGRTARSGKKGFAMSLVTPSHRNLIPRIEKMTRSRMTEGKIPTRKDIGAKKVTQTLAQFQAEHPIDRVKELLNSSCPSWNEALAKMSAEEVAGRFLSMMFPEIFAERKSEPTQSVTAERQPRSDRPRSSDRKFQGRSGERTFDRAPDRSRSRERSEGKFKPRSPFPPRHSNGDQPKRDRFSKGSSLGIVR